MRQFEALPLMILWNERCTGCQIIHDRKTDQSLDGQATACQPVKLINTWRVAAFFLLSYVSGYSFCSGNDINNFLNLFFICYNMESLKKAWQQLFQIISVKKKSFLPFLTQMLDVLFGIQICLHLLLCFLVHGMVKLGFWPKWSATVGWVYFFSFFFLNWYLHLLSSARIKNLGFGSFIPAFAW